MRLEPIAQHLEANGHGVIGQDLFYHHMPESIEEGLLVTMRLPAKREQYALAMRRGSFQVIARGRDEDALEERLRAVSSTLNAQGLQLGDMNFRFIHPKHDPLVYPRSDSRLVEAAVNFDFVFVQ